MIDPMKESGLEEWMIPIIAYANMGGFVYLSIVLFFWGFFGWFWFKFIISVICLFIAGYFYSKGKTSFWNVIKATVDKELEEVSDEG